MKLRIQADTLRLRLSQSEVQQFGETGRVASAIALGPAPEQALTYVLAQKPGIPLPEVSFSLNQLTVWVPTALAAAWTGSDQIGFDQEIAFENGRTLGILVEKDFACLHRQPGDRKE